MTDKTETSAEQPVELWRPSEERKVGTQMWQFMQRKAAEFGTDAKDYSSLHRFSVEQPDIFWNALIDYFDVQYQGNLAPVNLDTGFKTYDWYPEVKLNFAQNLLAEGEDDDTAIISVLENGQERELTYSQLRAQVATFQNTIADNFSEGDVLACYMPNVPETAIAMLAATGLGGVFTSTSSDFGIDGVIDRFSQSKPRIMVAAAGYILIACPRLLR